MEPTEQREQIQRSMAAVGKQVNEIHQALARSGAEGMRKVAPLLEAFAAEVRKIRLLQPSRLWNIHQVAEHWDVSVSRAQAILAQAGVKSGYDPDAVKGIPRPGRGARTDLKEF